MSPINHVFSGNFSWTFHGYENNTLFQVYNPHPCTALMDDHQVATGIEHLNKHVKRKILQMQFNI